MNLIGNIFNIRELVKLMKNGTIDYIISGI